MRQALLVCFVFSALTLGCKKSDDSNNGGGDAATVFDAPPLSGDVYSLKWPTQTTHMGDEQTQCIWMRLNNASPIKVHQIHNTLAQISHHLIIYKDDVDTTEQLTPMACRGFTGALNPSGNVAPLVITQKQDDEVTLPDHVAYTLGANQMIKIELHWINSTDGDADTNASINFYSADPATITDEAGVLFSGSLDINIPAQGQATLHQFLTLPKFLRRGAQLDERAGEVGVEDLRDHRSHSQARHAGHGRNSRLAHRHGHDGLQPDAVQLVRAADHDLRHAVQCSRRRRLRLPVQLDQPHQRCREVRRVGESGDVLLLGLLLPGANSEGLRAHGSAGRAERNRPLLPVVG